MYIFKATSAPPRAGTTGNQETTNIMYVFANDDFLCCMKQAIKSINYMYNQAKWIEKKPQIDLNKEVSLLR